MTITLRQESATGATTKGSALTYAELDNNFVHLLRQGSVSVGADSGTQQTLGEADRDSLLNIIGGTDISTTVSAPDSAGATTVEIAFTGSAGIANIVEDTTPQLGGNLDVNGNSIVSVTNGDITITPDGSGNIQLDGQQWPNALGGNNEFLTTNASGILSWTAITQATGSELENVSEDTTPQLGGDLDVNGQSIVSVSNGNIAITPNGTGQVQTTNLRYDEDIHALGTTSGTITPDVANGNVQTITLDGNLTFNAFSNPIAGQSLTLIIDTNGTGRTLTTTMKTPDATDPTMSTTDTIDICTVFYDGTNYYMNYVTNFA